VALELVVDIHWVDIGYLLSSAVEDIAVEDIVVEDIDMDMDMDYIEAVEAFEDFHKHCSDLDYIVVVEELEHFHKEHSDSDYTELKDIFEDFHNRCFDLDCIFDLHIADFVVAFRTDLGMFPFVSGLDYLFHKHFLHLLHFLFD
jgi:hypothetical protein